MGNPPRTVPWSNQEEWETVYSWLYPTPEAFEPAAMQELGVKRVKSWASRGKNPNAVEATAALVEVWLRDGCGGSFPSSVTEHEIRLLYTVAFIRFVNGIVDRAQKGVYASSVASVARELGLPGWFVDLRHSGTHDRLPTLTILRSGCAQALKWLEANYWTVQKSYVADTSFEVRELLGRYKTIRKAELRESGAIKSGVIITEISMLLTSESYKEILLPILLETGFLVPTAKKKRAIYPDLNLSLDLANLWFPLLDQLEGAWPGFFEDLFVAIVDRLGDPFGMTQLMCARGVDRTKDEDTERESSNAQGASYLATITAWARSLLKKNRESKSEDGLEACLRNPTIYTRCLLDDFVATQPEWGSRLSPLLSYIDSILALQKSQQKSGAASDAAPSIELQEVAMDEELRMLRARVDSVQAHGSGTQSSKVGSAASEAAIPQTWLAIPASEWRPCPIGSLPGGAIPCLDLPLILDDYSFAEAAGVFQFPLFEQTGAISSERDEMAMDLDQPAHSARAVSHPQETDFKALAREVHLF
ncbi:Las1-like-domain-containing protein [Blyttiomyces helicus]|uniref:Las1-like-domain-containing protein n=1 Tax=Blyttiomyces helicus TaxID=388810 RepID=A0A4P9WDQ0_9FUNG|nr:Las1-like-domain-containing protein [Blyttiomyces helicus]|eukprot:RKO89803.1 Las1-like-domain-containing protein [Blyttiomyces helicus]